MSAFFTLSQGPLGPSPALGAGGGGAGGGGGGSSSSGSTTSSSSGGGSTSSSGGMASCLDDGVCHALTEDCTCADCKPLAMCVPDQCVNDGLCDLKDACICVDCRQDLFCSNPAHCKDDSKCDSFTEGCQCKDCTQKAECLSGPPISTSSGAEASSSGSTSGAGGSTSSASGTGGSPDTGAEGCSTRPGGQGPLIPLGMGILVAGAALLARRRR